jgi:diguanylate cyclase (GGDEF)-like protein
MRPIAVSWGAMNAIQTRRLTQEVEDTYRRALIGGLFYLAAWMVVGNYGGAFSRAPTASWLLVLAFTALAMARFARRPPRAADASRLFSWLQVHWLIVIATTTLWGGVFLWTMLDPAFAPARTAALLTTLGLAIAFAHTYSMRRGFALVGIAALYLPGLVLLWGDPHDRAVALVMSVYLIYVVISLLRSHADYQERLDLDQVLRDQRDLFAQQSRIDPLTELANRRHFADVLANASQRAQSTGAPLCLLLLDIDYFKKINDTYGHAVGDACLIAIAERLRAQFSGEGGLAARLGGEEFGVVLDGHELSAAARRAEVFREELARQPFELDGIRLPVTVSLGLAEFDPIVHRHADGLYRAADRAVYRAKSAGRNCLCLDEPSLA